MLNPATQEVLAKVPKAGAAETRAAIAEANAVFPMWKSQPAKQRADVMKKCVMSHYSRSAICQLHKWISYSEQVTSNVRYIFRHHG